MGKPKHEGLDGNEIRDALHGVDDGGGIFEFSHHLQDGSNGQLGLVHFIAQGVWDNGEGGLSPLDLLGVLVCSDAEPKPISPHRQQVLLYVS